MAEFKTFMSRREYKIINKRLRRGLRQTIESGGYVANAPYGYRKIEVDKKPTLEIVEPEAKFVRMMYEMYADGYGCVSIARQIQRHGGQAPPDRTPLPYHGRGYPAQPHVYRQDCVGPEKAYQEGL